MGFNTGFKGLILYFTLDRPKQKSVSNVWNSIIRIITYSFLTVDNLLILYLTLVRPKHKSVSNVWNSIIRIITYSFLTVDSLLILYLTLVRPKHKSVSNVWNSIISTEAKQLQRNQHRFLSIWQ